MPFWEFSKVSFPVNQRSRHHGIHEMSNKGYYICSGMFPKSCITVDELMIFSRKFEKPTQL